MNDLGKKSLYIKTFGCQMNEYDSEKMVMLLANEYSRVENPEQADLILVNTCSVRDKAESKLFCLLGTFKPLKDRNPDLIIGVGGCVAQQEGSNISKRSKLVDFIVGTHNISLVPSLVSTARNSTEPQIAIDYREDWEELPDDLNAMPSLGSTEKSTFNTPVRALVAIQRGCDKMCTYCIVPKTRGKQVSRDLKEIVKEVKAKVRMGAREVMLLGQTVNSYGLDLLPRAKFSTLISEIANIEGVKRIRFISPHPQEIKDDFLKLYSSIPTLCPHIHLPLQSGSNRILKAMNRNYKRERFIDIVNSLRDTIATITLTTDVIVGFPTETDSEFEQTLDLLHSVKFQSVFAYKYSIRPDTVGSLSYGPEEEIEESIKSARLSKLIEIQSDITLQHNESLVGTEQEILIESQGKLPNTYRGRTNGNIFGELVLSKTFSGKSPISEIVKGTVVRASPHGLKLIESEELSNLKDTNLITQHTYQSDFQ